MLVELRVKNFALVDDKCIQFAKGMTAFTGETGAGKSLLLNAVTLLLGSKAQKEMVRDGQNNALVEGVFDLSSDPTRLNWLEENGFSFEKEDGHLLLVKREISLTPKGRHRIWIQGLSATRHQLQELLGDWIEVSGQHEFLRLNKDSYLLDVLDQYAHNTKELKDYSSLYERLKELEEELAELLSNSDDKSSLLDLKKFQLEELSKAKVSSALPSEYEHLISTQKKLKSKETLIEATQNATALLEGAMTESGNYGAIEATEKSLSLLSRYTDLDPAVQKAVEALQNAHSLLLDAKAYIQDSTGTLDTDPKSLEKIESRISVLNRLKRKFRCEIEELIDLRATLEKEIENLENFDDKIQDLKKQIQHAQTNASKQASVLHQKRIIAAKTLEKKWAKGVQELGMPKASFELTLEKSEKLSAKGFSQLALLFSANPGSKPRPIKQVASGGELSRILLALKHIVSNKSEVCAYLFDEIDTGIGGETAQTVGLRLREISESSQVIVVTHLPQVAALASDHFLIKKETTGKETKTEILELRPKDREIEIARMLGSSKSKAATSLAKEMLKRDQKK